MTRGEGRLVAGVAGTVLLMSSLAARAGVWGADPLVGFIGDYSTNPALLDVAHTSQLRAAVTLDAPITYVGNAFTFSALPRLRVGDSPGFSSTTSDYQHLDLKAEFDSERGLVTASASVARDSSLYYDYLLSGGEGVERESATAAVKALRQLTERISLETDVDSSRVRYANVHGTAELVDYSYSEIAPTLTWSQSEKGKLTLSPSASLYKSRDGTTTSVDVNLQAGFSRRISQIWSLTTQFGYSRASNRLDTHEEFLVSTANGPVIVSSPVKVDSTQNGTVFSVGLTRQAQSLLLTAQASRLLVPSGFAFLSRQQSYELSATYPLSARWSLSADTRYLKAQDPSIQGVYGARSVQYVSASSAWRWTERWTLTFAASHVAEAIDASAAKAASTEISVQLSRQFDRIKF